MTQTQVWWVKNQKDLVYVSFFNSLLFIGLRCYFSGILSHIQIFYGFIFCILSCHNLKNHPVFFFCVCKPYSLYMCFHATSRSYKFSLQQFLVHQLKDVGHCSILWIVICIKMNTLLNKYPSQILKKYEKCSLKEFNELCNLLQEKQPFIFTFSTSFWYFQPHRTAFQTFRYKNISLELGKIWFLCSHSFVVLACLYHCLMHFLMKVDELDFCTWCFSLFIKIRMFILKL